MELESGSSRVDGRGSRGRRRASDGGSHSTGGAWVSIGTRVPVRALFENLEEGASLTDFLTWFPGVTREQAVAVLSHAEQSLITA